MPIHLGPTNMTAQEMSPFCDVLVLTDIFLFHLRNRRMDHGEHFLRIRHMKKILRFLLIAGCRPYSPTGQIIVNRWIEIFHHYFIEIVDRYLSRFP